MDSLKALGLCLLPALILGGCAQLPVDGPSDRDIGRAASVAVENDRDSIVSDYALLDINKHVLDVLDASGYSSFAGTFGSYQSSSPMAKIGPGDVIQVSVFESEAGGLFLPQDGTQRTGNFVTIPNLMVNRDGSVSVPYAGTIRAGGRTITEVERDVEAKLRSRAIEPQVSINFIEQNNSMVDVIGEGVGAEGKFKIAGNGDRLLDMIAKAGGLRYPGYEEYVTLLRNGRQSTVYFPTIVDSARENVYMLPGDVIYVHHHQQKFISFGAFGNSSQTSGVNGQFPFEQEHLSLNEAVAKAGGLQDGRANPQQVFVYRLETRETLEKMGVKLSNLSKDKLVPTIYRANYRDPSSFFFAQRFNVRNNDVIYAANADAIEVTKFMTYARSVTDTVAGVTSDVVLTNDLFKGAALAK